jgi:hypothetical protein
VTVKCRTAIIKELLMYFHVCLGVMVDVHLHNVHLHPYLFLTN